MKACDGQLAVASDAHGPRRAPHSSVELQGGLKHRSCTVWSSMQHAFDDVLSRLIWDVLTLIAIAPVLS